MLNLKSIIMKKEAINPSENPESESPRFNPSQADPVTIVRYHVFNIVAKVARIDIRKINDNSHLKFDLGISTNEKKVLMKYFNEVLKGMHSMKFVNMDECIRLEYVSDCVKLVLSKLH